MKPSFDVTRGDLCLCGVPTFLHRDATTNKSIGCVGAARRVLDEQALKPFEARSQERVGALHIVHRSGDRDREVGIR